MILFNPQVQRFDTRRLIMKLNFVTCSRFVFITGSQTKFLTNAVMRPLLLRPRLYGEKLSRVEGSPAYPSYPGRANFSYISQQNLANRLHEKQKVGSARRVTRLPAFGSPSRVNFVKARHSDHARALFSALGSGKGVNFFLV